MSEHFDNKPYVKVPINTRAPGNAYAHKKAENTPDEYYLKLSHTMRICRYVTVCLLSIFIAVTVCAYSDDINAENAGRLLSTFKIDFSESTALSVADMSFGHGDSFGVCRSYPAVFSSGKLLFFGKNGGIRSSFGLNTEINSTVFTDRYVLLVSDNSVYAFDPSSLIKEIKFDRTVRSVYGCSDGKFAVLTDEPGYRSAVYVYGNDFDILYKWQSADKNVLELSVSENGLLTLTVSYTENGEYISKILRTDTLTGQITEIGTDRTLLTTHTFSDGSFCTVSKNSISCYSEDNSLINSLSTDGDIISVYGSESCICTVTENRILNLTDSSGNVAVKKILSDIPAKLCIYGNDIYLLYSDRIEKTDTKSNEVTVYTADDPVSLVPSSNSYAVFTENEIKSLNNCQRRKNS